MANRESVKKVQKVRRKNLPVKRSINLAGLTEKKMNWRVAVPAILLILALAALVGKIAVVDRYAAVAQAEGQVADLQRQLDEGYARLEGYADLNEKYAHYTLSGMTPEELGRSDRVALIELLQRIVFSQAVVNTWSVSGNRMTLNLTGGTLQQINMIAQQLESDDMVDFCTVATAETNEPVTWGEGTSTGVMANMVVYLNSTEGGSRG